MSFSFYEVNSYWRPYELKAAKKHLGKVEEDFSKSDFLLCRTNTETVNSSILSSCINIENKFKNQSPSKILVNPSENYKFANNKDECFSVWRENNIPHPESKIITKREDLEEVQFPYLLRLNDGVTGEDTYLIKNEKDIDKYYPNVRLALERKRRINTKIVCVKFIDTSTIDGYNLSYRIIAAGNKVVCGYARISDDWLAITKQFTEDKKEAFVRENKKLENVLKVYEKVLVKAMHTAGHHHVGIDVIPDQEGNIFLLEIQPFYFCGNMNRTTPPFWNPYKPPELVNWLVSDEKNLKSEIPTYYEKWLNKEQHFDTCYRAIKELV